MKIRWSSLFWGSSALHFQIKLWISSSKQELFFSTSLRKIAQNNFLLISLFQKELTKYVFNL
jgi:hypothetical protein